MDRQGRRSREGGTVRPQDLLGLVGLEVESPYVLDRLEDSVEESAVESDIGDGVRDVPAELGQQLPQVGVVRGVDLQAGQAATDLLCE
jgi:hypothetical protein